MRVIWFVPPALEQVRIARGLALADGPQVHGTFTASSDEQFTALRSGAQDAAVTALDNVVLWNRRETEVRFRILAQIEATTAISLVTRPDCGDIASLKGKRLLVDSPTNGFVVALMAMLAGGGVEFSQCRVLAAGGVRERFDKLLQGEGDATLLGPPFVGMAEAAGMLRLEDADRAFPGFPGQGVVVREDRLADLRGTLVAWLAALELARQEALRDPARAIADLLSAGLPPPAAQALVGAVGQTLVPSVEGIALLLAQREALGLPGGADTYEELVDCGPLDEALALIASPSAIIYPEGAAR